MITGPTIEEQADEALKRLRHSIATSAGMHKRQIRLRAEAMRAAIEVPSPMQRRVDQHRQLLAAGEFVGEFV